MAGICTVFLALNMTFGGLCVAPHTIPQGVGDSDPDVFDYVKPEPPPPKPRVVTMPPVIVEKQVVVEVEKPVIVEKQITQTVTEYIQPDTPQVQQPTALQIALQEELQTRRGNQSQLPNGNLDGALRSAPRSVARSNQNLPHFPPPEGIGSENSKYSAPRSYSTTAVDSTRILTADRYITGILESGVNSQLSENGTVVVQVSRDVYGAHGRTKLVPKGSRMICRYAAVDKVGQTRVGFSCGRILLAESRAEIYQLNAHLGDAQGYAGLSGEVDNRFWEKYGSAILTVGIGSAVEAAVLSAQSADTSDSNIIGDSATGVSENVGAISASILEDTVDLTPIIRIAQGTRVQIRPEKDWYLADPVTVN
ncbi:TrbI/VirB10 family protein [Cohaesibacter celericrescens]|uniref:Conjugal transfer protein TrbI n=1 Tax=Cohaesibacter celericrescens TaxID=2067669 RepID=A0A2N5XRW1_9HYPH|nr:TrbI/VirB10 family protein [Cohaesibacter celericrescens]PLW77187.1 conjugal transfer protein TrbI [Cohaesibacter celericrescens]